MLKICEPVSRSDIHVMPGSRVSVALIGADSVCPKTHPRKIFAISKIGNPALRAFAEQNFCCPTRYQMPLGTIGDSRSATRQSEENKGRVA